MALAARWDEVMAGSAASLTAAAGMIVDRAPQPLRKVKPASDMNDEPAQPPPQEHAFPRSE
jgi:hypothetical protein